MFKFLWQRWPNFTLKFCLLRASSPYRIDFSVYFFSILILKESSKRCLIFPYFSALFEKSASISCKELLFNHIFKKCLIFEDLYINKKKAEPFWSAFIRVAPVKILKGHCNAFVTWSSPSTTNYKHLEKQGNNFTSLVALIFPRNLMCYCLIFHLPNYLIALKNKWSEAAIHNCARKVVVQ